MKELKIHFLNTIWSDAILLENNNHYAFVDSGSKFYYPMIQDHLTQYNINKIDFIILTHFHSDHYGNVEAIINDYEVGKIYLKHFYGLDGITSSGFDSNEEYTENEFKQYHKIIEACNKRNVEIIYLDEIKSDTLTINFENIDIELYDIKNTIYEIYNDSSSPYYNQKRFSENYNSIGVFIKINNNTIFLGGDVTCSKSDILELNGLCIKMINKIYDKYQISNIDIYKSCHHGGSGTNTLDLCNLLKTKYAIITNTARWLDHYSTFDNLRSGNKDVKILPTDFQKYIFKINDKIDYEVIKETSLFITLGKN